MTETYVKEKWRRVGKEKAATIYVDSLRSALNQNAMDPSIKQSIPFSQL